MFGRNDLFGRKGDTSDDSSDKARELNIENSPEIIAEESGQMMEGTGVVGVDSCYIGAS